VPLDRDRVHTNYKLSSDLKVVNHLCDNFSHREVTAEDIYYNQGFSDAIKLIVQSMVWSPVRR